MNLVQQANFLEDVPKEQLAQMSQDPNAQFPPFLVLSEIQRRTTNEKNYQAMQQQPTTTVAEEVVNEFMQPQLAENQSQGLQVGAPQSATPLPDSNISAGLSGVPTAPPMQMAASGGITGYNPGGMFSLMNAASYSPSTNSQDYSNESIPVESLSQDQRAEIVEKSEGLTGAQKAILGLNALSLGLLVTPVPGARIASGATRLLSMGINAGRGLKGLYDTARAGRLLKAGQAELKRRGGVPPTTPYNPNTVIEAGRQTLRQELPYKLLGGSTLAGSTYALMDGDSPLSLNPNETIEKEETKKTEPNIGPTYNKLMSQMNNSDTNSSQGLGQGQMDYRDMIRMGVGIMGAKDMSELGSAVTDTLDASDARATTGLQQQYLQAQTDKLQADIAAMPVKEIQSEISIYSKYLDQVKENSEGTEADIRNIKNITDYINALSQELMTARGIDLASLDKQKKSLEASGIGKV